jgi:LL-diaminopimelate aminotransferase
MALVNEHFLKLPNNYLFADIAKKVNAFKVTHPKADIISLGIGDVTQPLCPAVIEAMHKAADEMGTASGFHGYGPEQGYDFLREAILKNDFLPRGIHLDIDEILSTTAPRVIRAISRNSSVGTIPSVSPILSTPSILTQMS